MLRVVTRSVRHCDRCTRAIGPTDQPHCQRESPARRTALLNGDIWRASSDYTNVCRLLLKMFTNGSPRIGDWSNSNTSSTDKTTTGRQRPHARSMSRQLINEKNESQRHEAVTNCKIDCMDIRYRSLGYSWTYFIC